MHIRGTIEDVFLCPNACWYFYPKWKGFSFDILNFVFRMFMVKS